MRKTVQQVSDDASRLFLLVPFYNKAVARGEIRIVISPAGRRGVYMNPADAPKKPKKSPRRR